MCFLICLLCTCIGPVCVLFSSQASVTVIQALEVNNAPSVSCSTGEIHGSSATVNHTVTFMNAM